MGLDTPIPGKRNAVRSASSCRSGEIVVLVDSDTVWTDGTLAELVKPFADPPVGGVTTRQRILEPERGLLTRWADWLENTRALYSMPAQSVLGRRLPARTHDRVPPLDPRRGHGRLHDAAVPRRLPRGVRRPHADQPDAQGAATAPCTSRRAWSTPTPRCRCKKLVKQQFRWARGSQYNTLRMLPWMLGHAPVLAFFFLADIVLPFLLAARAIAVDHPRSHRNTARSTSTRDCCTCRSHALLAIVALTVLTSTLSMCLRQIAAHREVPVDLLWMPVYILFSTLVLMPIRLFGFLRLGHVGGWGTRATPTSGGGTRPSRERRTRRPRPAPAGPTREATAVLAATPAPARARRRCGSRTRPGDPPLRWSLPDRPGHLRPGSPPMSATSSRRTRPPPVPPRAAHRPARIVPGR